MISLAERIKDTRKAGIVQMLRTVRPLFEAAGIEFSASMSCFGGDPLSLVPGAAPGSTLTPLCRKLSFGNL